MATKPLILHGHTLGPNPWKVAIILEELNVPYEHKFLEFADMKKTPFESLNPNGRVPVLEDPNTGVVVFESGAIIEYLVDTYDKDSSLSISASPEKYQLKSWLHFQMSGQGPYYGQKAWFSHYHSEQLPSAQSRYADEIKRVVGVIDRHLRTKSSRTGTGTPYLVGDKCTYADLAFVPWHMILPTFLMPGWDFKAEFSVFAQWNDSLMSRLSVQKVAAEKARVLKLGSGS